MLSLSLSLCFSCITSKLSAPLLSAMWWIPVVASQRDYHSVPHETYQTREHLTETQQFATHSNFPAPTCISIYIRRMIFHLLFFFTSGRVSVSRHRWLGEGYTEKHLLPTIQTAGRRGKINSERLIRVKRALARKLGNPNGQRDQWESAWMPNCAKFSKWDQTKTFVSDSFV